MSTFGLLEINNDLFGVVGLLTNLNLLTWIFKQKN